MGVIWDMNHIWQGLITPQTAAWTPTTSRYAQLLPWFSERRTWSMYLISHIEVQWRWYLYGYAILMFCECCIRHGPCPTCEDHPTYYSMTKNFTWTCSAVPLILNQWAWTIHIISCGVVQGQWYMYWYATPLFYEFYITLTKQWDYISIHTCIIILGPLQHWWGAWFKLLGLRPRVTAEHFQGVVCGHALVCGVIHTYQIWAMLHMTLMKQWDSISIPVSSSLEHYTTDEIHSSGYPFRKPG